MAPTKTGKAAPVAKPKKEKINHPASRKAGQLARNSLRKGKLGNLASKSRQKQHSLGAYHLSSSEAVTDIHAFIVDVYGFFYHAMPEDGSVLTLEALHSLVRDIWLTRHDLELEEERAARRKGRPKSVKEAKLEDINAREMDEYRTGMGTLSYRFHPYLAVLTLDYQRSLI